MNPDMRSADEEELLIDARQWRVIREVMGDRYVTAVTLFLEHTDFGIERMVRAVAGQRLPDVFIPIAARIKDSAMAIGANGLGKMADALEREAESAAEQGASAETLGPQVERLQQCFEETRHIFLSVQTLLPHEAGYADHY
jgi:hypothetical protein